MVFIDENGLVGWYPLGLIEEVQFEVTWPVRL
jgi:hypothetical protein